MEYPLPIGRSENSPGASPVDASSSDHPAVGDRPGEAGASSRAAGSDSCGEFVPLASGTAGATPGQPSSRKRRAKRRDSFLDVSFVILLALFLALVLKTYVAEAYMIRGHSMEPTFRDNERVMVQKVFFDMDRGDVIIFSSKDDPRKDLIKRVVGLPGDQVQVIDGEVYLNGKKLDEDYITPYRYARGEVYGPRIVPEGTVFVLGDNRPESQDSRAFHAVSMSSVKGKVILRWWPAGEIRTF